MTETEGATIQQQAIAWHVRLREAGDEEWDSFLLWLEADPARSAAFDAASRADHAIEAAAFPSGAANDDRHEDGRRKLKLHRSVWGILAATAAGVAALAVAPSLLGTVDSRYEIATAPGQQRTLALEDGSVARLNGSTRLVLDHAYPRAVELAAGEAVFEVRHDAAHPFVVTAGNQSVTDVGTAFNVVRDGPRFAIEVIEGAVRYERRDGAVALSAGQILAVRGSERPVLDRAQPRTMAGWRRGQLSYRSAPISNVAGDLTRSLGVEVSVDPSLAAMPFTGSVRAGKDAEAAVSGFAATLGLRARRQGNSWRIERGPATSG